VNNDNSHFARAEQKLRKRTPEEVRLHTASQNRYKDDADVTWRGRSFQVRAAATGKARSPTVDSRVRRTGSDVVSADRWRVLIVRSAGWRSSSARYVGAVPYCARTAIVFCGLPKREDYVVVAMAISE